MAVADKPERTDFMDPDMRRIWRSLGPMPHDLRLYGGTALALYRNHRASTDFDFATPLAGAVTPELVASLPYFRAESIDGGPGMVDAKVAGGRRLVNLTFMEVGAIVPAPRREPVAAPNGVAVAHPQDLVASKIFAATTRDAVRDYVDLAEAVRAWPREARLAAAGLPGRDPGRVVNVARLLSNIPAEIRGRLDDRDLRAIDGFCRRLAADRSRAR